MGGYPATMLALSTIGGVVIIIACVVALILVAFAGYGLIIRGSRASKGGVEPPPEDRGTRHPPPVESFERRS